MLVVHLPWPLDAAASAALLHAGLHAGFAVAGAVVGLAWPDVRELGRILLVVLTMSLMTILSLAEISGAFLYAAYPPGQAATSGIVMLAGMGVFWVGLAFADVPARLSRRRRPMLAGALGLILLVLIAGSYAFAG